MRQLHKQLHKQQGFSLIEALVAFLILSVGMLGIASLQVLSLKAGHTAALRTVAVMKAEEIVERMRANPSMLASYAVALGATGTKLNCNDKILPLTSCTPAQMAQDDIAYWLEAIKVGLPDNVDTRASVTYTTPVPGTQPLALVTVRIEWKERDPESKTLVAQNYSTSLQMFCNAAAAGSSC